jgi:hypothetical protein
MLAIAVLPVTCQVCQGSRSPTHDATDWISALQGFSPVDGTVDKAARGRDTRSGGAS